RIGSDTGTAMMPSAEDAGWGVIMRKLAWFLFLVLGLSSVWAQTPRVDRINIVAKGVYQAEITKSVEDKNLATGQRQIVGNIKLVANTTSVPAQSPVQFGFQYVILGAPSNATISVKMVTIYPKEGLKNPKTHETSYRDEYMIDKTI